jgi:hypothetical protein
VVLSRLEDVETGGSAGPWFEGASAWADEADIIDKDGGFDPEAPVLREGIAMMFFRYAQHIGLDTSARASLDGFTDGGAVSEEAKDAMSWAVAVGLFEGNKAGALNPDKPATRAEVAILFERLVKLVVNE